jgi:hypothetical protein
MFLSKWRGLPFPPACEKTLSNLQTALFHQKWQRAPIHCQQPANSDVHPHSVHTELGRLDRPGKTASSIYPDDYRSLYMRFPGYR